MIKPLMTATSFDKNRKFSGIAEINKDGDVLYYESAELRYDRINRWSVDADSVTRYYTRVELDSAMRNWEDGEVKIAREQRWQARMAMGYSRIPGNVTSATLRDYRAGNAELWDQIVVAVAEVNASSSIDVRRPFTAKTETHVFQWRWIRATARAMGMTSNELLDVAVKHSA